MAKNDVKNVLNYDNDVKVNEAPEGEEEMDENKEFVTDDIEDLEDSAEDLAGNEEPENKKESDKSDDEDKKPGFIKRVFGWFKKHWKGLLASGLIVVVGGTVFVYFMGKKQIKLGKVSDIAEKISDNQADVIDFTEAMEKIEAGMKAANE